MSEKNISDLVDTGTEKFRVYVDKELLLHYQKAANEKKTEVNAIHHIDFIENNFYVSCERFVPKQKNTATTTHTDPADYLPMHKLKGNFKCDIHTHPMDSSSPSGTDLTCYDEWAMGVNDYLVNIIISQTSVTCLIYLFRGVGSMSLEIKVYNGTEIDLKPNLVEQLYEKQYEEKVTAEIITYNQHTWNADYYRDLYSNPQKIDDDNYYEFNDDSYVDGVDAYGLSKWIKNIKPPMLDVDCNFVREVTKEEHKKFNKQEKELYEEFIYGTQGYCSAGKVQI